MENTPNDDSVLVSSSPGLRVWPAVVLLGALAVLKCLPALAPEPSMAVIMAQFMGPLAVAVLILLWWVGFSRATGREKLFGLGGFLAILLITNFIADPSIRGFLYLLFALPWGITAFAGSLVMLASRPAVRLGICLAVTLLVFGVWDLLRADAIHGDFSTELAWRWTPTAEDRFLDRLASRSSSEVTPELIWPDQPEWPGFRGDARDGVQPDVQLIEDWEASPPKELWRIAVGPGWSSFSVAGDRLFTQEQRGEQETVVCYEAASGKQLWTHQTEARFWEAVGGAGPRATPTIDGDALFTCGASGDVLRLDPKTGEQVWRRDLREDGERDPPMWGFSASPLVTHGVVIVYAGGAGEKGIVAYDRETGRPTWTAPAGDHSYSSAHLAELGGRPVVLTLTNTGLSVVDPTDGSLLGEHDWLYQGYRVVQPLVPDDSTVLLGTAMGAGTRKLLVTAVDDGFELDELWTSDGMSPYFNDFVAHEGFLYGFDNNVFACLDLETGERIWKRGRYGNGQVVLLPSAGQLLVISEDGELVLLRTNPREHEELARFRVLEGRTWNHPVIVGNRLYVRNGEEAVCFQMPVVSTETAAVQ